MIYRKAGQLAVKIQAFQRKHNKKAKIYFNILLIHMENMCFLSLQPFQSADINPNKKSSRVYYVMVCIFLALIFLKLLLPK